MTKHSRRDLLRFAALGAAAGSLSSFQPLRAMCGRAIPSSADKLLVIYLRGAMDAIYTVAPPESNPGYASARAGLLTPIGANPILLDSAGFARLSSHFELLAQSGGPIPVGHAHFAMMVGNPGGKRSHFTEQQISETAIMPDQFTLGEEGVFARLAKAAAFDPGLPMASVGSNLQRFFQSTDPLVPHAAHIKSLAEYDLGHEDQLYHGVDISASMIGFADEIRLAMDSHYKQPGGAVTSPAKDVEAVAEFVLDSELVVKGVSYTHSGTEFPTSPSEIGALPVYPFGFGMMQRCEEAVEILEHTECSVVGVDIGGWDTHTNQAEQRALTDQWLAKALHSLYVRSVSSAFSTRPLTILVVTEFGRTNRKNTILGTDHGIGGLTMAFGPKVNGGVSNMRAAGFPDLSFVDLSNPALDNALPVRTDFRTIYKELFSKRFNMSSAQLNTILPAPFTGTTQQLTQLNMFKTG